MQSSQMSSNPLLQSIVHASFRKSIHELGLPDLPESLFAKEIAPFLRLPDSLFEDTPETRRKLWVAVVRGQVIAAEAAENLAFAFYVRASVGGRGMDIRLVCESRTWHIDKVIAMYPRRMRGSRWFARSVFGASVVAAGVIGYLLHMPQPEAPGTAAPVTSNHAAMPSAAHNAAQPSAQPSAAPSQAANRTGSQAKSQPAAKKQEAPAKPAVQKLSFTLTEGMPLDDLSQFLKAHHLVQSAVAFDMLMKNTKADRDVRPGVYVFTSNMTEQQLIATLKKGPSDPSGN
ncbi:MltG/YceG/YrrL family protein [Alicyclobacillus cycloheptanicus]|uniref:YceG-like family protein n=1 Tax=Alicyclobacillus cycloheptanicus TaxID=1457 RepID=A0ABT9XJB2_9BACL|nr:hypothetical protein [Alicyclobacillus cycloheptanicus]MDQ0190292.1 hypothetical protein [Alicyclobacillus cycloheptanicus]